MRGFALLVAAALSAGVATVPAVTPDADADSLPAASPVGSPPAPPAVPPVGPLAIASTGSPAARPVSRPAVRPPTRPVARLRPASPTRRPAPDVSTRIVYLTFDDGPGPWTSAVLRTLRAHGAKATFFVLGREATAYPSLLRRLRAEGHAVANHTWDHPRLTRLPELAVAQEIERTEGVLGRTSCVRPPYGATSAQVGRVIAAGRHREVLWDVDPRDWSRPGSAVIAARVLAGVHPGAVVLMHDGGGDRSQTVHALEVVLRGLSAQGYRFDSLPSC